VTALPEQAPLDARFGHRRERQHVEGPRGALAVAVNRLGPFGLSGTRLAGDDERNVRGGEGRKRVLEATNRRARAYESGGAGASRAVEGDGLITGSRHTHRPEQAARHLCQYDTNYGRRGIPYRERTLP